MQRSVSPPRKLLDQARAAVRLKHYSYRTKETYGQLIRRYILFHNKRHTNQMGVPEFELFLTHLAVQERIENVTPSHIPNFRWENLTKTGISSTESDIWQDDRSNV